MESKDSSDDDEGRVGPWYVRPYQAFVRATLVSSEVPALLDVLAHGEQAVESSVVARLDGDAHDYVFIFDPQLGAGPAEALVAALTAAELPSTNGVVGDVRGLDAMVQDARAAGQQLRLFSVGVARSKACSPGRNRLAVAKSSRKNGAARGGNGRNWQMTRGVIATKMHNTGATPKSSVSKGFRGWAIQDSNLGPLPYQRSALTN
jgi:hypothetical protein